MVYRKFVFWIPLVFAASLLFAGWYLRRPERSLFTATVFLLLGVLLTGLAIVYFRSARDLAIMLEQRGAIARPIHRRWLPARFFSARTYFWQLRATGVIGAFIGVEFIAVGVLFFMHHR